MVRNRSLVLERHNNSIFSSLRSASHVVNAPIFQFAKVIQVRKMPKTKKKAQSTSSDSDSGPEDRNPPASKKAKESSKPAAKTTSTGGSSGDGETIWTLEKMRQVRINEFRGRKMVDIREFYEKDGETLPGRKGISLSLTQWKKLLEVADEVNRALED